MDGEFERQYVHFTHVAEESNAGGWVLHSHASGRNNGWMHVIIETEYSLIEAVAVLAYGHLAESLSLQSLYKSVNPNHCGRRCDKTVVQNTELPIFNGGLGCIRRMGFPKRSARKEEIKQNGRKVLSTLQFK